MEAEMMRAMMVLLVMMLVMTVGGCDDRRGEPNPPEPLPRVGLGAGCQDGISCAGDLTCREFYAPAGGTYSRCYSTCLLEAEPGARDFCGGCSRPEDEGDSPVSVSVSGEVGLCYPGRVPLDGACRYTDDCDEGACWDGVCSYGPPPED